MKVASYISIKKARDFPGLFLWGFFYGAFFMGDVCGLSAHQDMPEDMDSKIAKAKPAAYIHAPPYERGNHPAHQPDKAGTDHTP